MLVIIHSDADINVNNLKSIYKPGEFISDIQTCRNRCAGFDRTGSKSVQIEQSRKVLPPVIVLPTIVNQPPRRNLTSNRQAVK